MADSNDFFSSFGLHHDSNFFHRVSYAEDELAGGSPSWRGRSSHNNDNSSRPWEDFVSPVNRSQPHPPSQRHDSYPNRNPFTPPPRVQYRDSADFSSDPFMRAVHTSQSSTSTYPYTPRFVATAPQLIPSAQPRTSTFHIPTQTPPSPEELFRYANSPRPPHPYFDDEMPPSASRSRKRPAPEPTSDRPKRTRVPDSEEEIDEVNLTSDDPMDAVLEKERQELLKSQENEGEDGPKRFGLW
ncbi:hypothetical protein B9Z65_7037 [Elsinoe australis]|uniref:Uncharacterized protein n=1 Tax=Elsinoe australis TaxID=40998 RepID=A0A2P7Z4F7_9PEZI|nr:hypothetical protein B9Z65_7037 [Elsinoe australis]